jgi:rod shape-determining protein MreC
VLIRGQRIGYLALAVFVGHVLLISVQVNGSPDSSLLRTLTFRTLTELQRVMASSVGAVRGVWNGYVWLQDVQEENAVLRETVDRLELRLQRQNALVQRAKSLQQLLELRDSTDALTLTAEVIGVDATPWFQTLTVARGSADGVRSDLAVIAPNGVVGRVLDLPGPRAAKVQLLIDRNAAAGAIIERTRLIGIVSGIADNALRMDYVSNLEDVEVGDRVLTSGTDGVYPRGFVIGVVSVVERGVDLYKSITVQPAVDASGLEDVLIVMSDERLVQAEGLQ